MTDTTTARGIADAAIATKAAPLAERVLPDVIDGLPWFRFKDGQFGMDDVVFQAPTTEAAEAAIIAEYGEDALEVDALCGDGCCIGSPWRLDENLDTDDGSWPSRPTTCDEEHGLRTHRPEHPWRTTYLPAVTS